MSNVSRWNGTDSSAIASVANNNWSISIMAKTGPLPFFNGLYPHFLNTLNTSFKRNFIRGYPLNFTFDIQFRCSESFSDPSGESVCINLTSL